MENNTQSVETNNLLKLQRTSIELAVSSLIELKKTDKNKGINLLGLILGTTCTLITLGVQYE